MKDERGQRRAELGLPHPWLGLFDANESIRACLAVARQDAESLEDCALFCAHPTSKTVTLGSNGTEEQIGRIGDEYQHHNKSSHLVRVASAATVNRRVASSNLARGAILPLWIDSLTQDVITTRFGCNWVQLRFFGRKVEANPYVFRDLLAKPTSSFNVQYTSVTLLFAWPSQKRIKSSGASCFRSHVVRKRRNA